MNRKALTQDATLQMRTTNLTENATAFELEYKNHFYIVDLRDRFIIPQ